MYFYSSIQFNRITYFNIDVVRLIQTEWIIFKQFTIRYLVDSGYTEYIGGGKK
jgi:hypothetical protein